MSPRLSVAGDSQVSTAAAGSMLPGQLQEAIQVFDEFFHPQGSWNRLNSAIAGAAFWWNGLVVDFQVRGEDFLAEVIGPFQMEC